MATRRRKAAKPQPEKVACYIAEDAAREVDRRLEEEGLDTLNRRIAYAHLRRAAQARLDRTEPHTKGV